MAKKSKKPKKSAGNTDVESYKHEAAKRKNIPTAENQSLVADDDKTVKVLRYPRNPDLDPQLVWRGKDEENDQPLEVAAPPIYIQEKIHPQALIEKLKQQTQDRQTEQKQQADFFSDFNGLPEGWHADATASYYHDEGNWQNRMILGDSLLVMGSLAEREALRGKVQCIYFDPPYGIKFNSNWQPSTKTRDVRDGKEESISREPEVVRAFRDTWKDGIHSYLSYLRDRLSIGRDLLADTGSIFVQIGDENVHLIRSILDEVFGPKNFVSLISVQKTSGQTSRFLPGVIDYIVWYAKNSGSLRYRSILELKPPIRSVDERYVCVETPGGDVIDLSVKHKRGDIPLPEGKVLRLQDTSSQTGSDSSRFPVAFEGKPFSPSGKRGWSFAKGLETRLIKSGRLFAVGSSLRWKNYHHESSYSAIANNWTDISPSGFGEDRIYVVQTITDIVARCILMTTDPGDLVLDPTCGSGTTAYVAEEWGRRWITIDTSRVALTLARARLMGARYDYYLLRDSKEGAAKEGEVTGKPPAEGPFHADLRQGFVYERAPHVTLKSIANNAEIDIIWDRYQTQLDPLRERLNKALKKTWEEWQIPREVDAKWPDSAKADYAKWWDLRRERQKEIDASIAHNADVEYLYDRPYKSRSVVRVAGPFTVESLSPHRVLPLEEDPYLAEVLGADETQVEAIPETTADPTDFAQVVYENLKASGVQNTKKGEAIQFEWLKPRVSRSGLVPFEGRYIERGETKRAAICIGPEYDTVGYELVRRAAREAADLYDTLIVCGFAFAPEVDDTRLNFGSLTVLKARMNQDLRMGDKLKATGAGNLFVIFGEPDLRIVERDDGTIQVEIRGMDIFDPTTGQIRSSRDPRLIEEELKANPSRSRDEFSDIKNDVAAWFIDDDYNEESFFVRQAYFVGESPYDALKRALKAEIDETAWAEMNSTISRPFPRPAKGRICVKVINHFGDEVQKVFNV